MKGRPLPPLPHLSATGSPAWQLLPQHWKYWSFATLGVSGESEIQAFQHRIFSLISRPNPLRASLLSPICSDTEAGTMADKPFPLGGAQPTSPGPTPPRRVRCTTCHVVIYVLSLGGVGCSPENCSPGRWGPLAFLPAPGNQGALKCYRPPWLHQEQLRGPAGDRRKS